MKKKSTLTTDSTHVPRSRSYSKLFNAVWCAVLLSIVFIASCKKDTFTAVQGLCPTVITDPMDKAVDVALNKVITLTFNTSMAASTITSSTFSIVPAGGTAISGTISPTSNSAVFTFTPTVPLLPYVLYTGTITTGVTDTLRTALVANYVWSFTTIPQVSATANPVAGGTVTGTGTYAKGSTAALTATPNTGYAFTNWTEAGVVVSTSASYSFALNGNRTLVANFAVVAPGSFAVNLSSSPAAGGSTTGSGTYLAGATVTAAATPSTGYTFVNWTDNGVAVSTSSSYQFIIAGNRTLVANFKVVTGSQFAVVLSSNPIAGGSTNGSGAFASGTSVTVSAVANPNYVFTNWTENGTIVSTSANYTFNLIANRTLVANFAFITYTVSVVAVNGGVVVTPNQATYNSGSSVQLTATPNPGYSFAGWSGDASGTVNPLTVVVNANKNIVALFTLNPAIGPGDINLGGAASFNILTKSGISTTGVTSIQGDIGVSPATSTAITGFGLIMDASGQFSKTPIVTGKVYASDYATPTPANLTTAINNMQTAFTTANGLVTPAPVVGLGAGNISGLTLPPGLYKWGTGVLITNQGVTLAGGPNDTWVFQISADLTVNNSANITLLGGAQAKHIYWVVGGQATLGTNVNFSGNILSQTLISINTGSSVTGRMLAQTAVTLNADVIVFP